VTPQDELDGFISKYTPDIQQQLRSVLNTMRQRLPGAIELVYDNYNALAIGFGPTERASDVVLSIAAFPRWVSLFFFNGVNLPDPERRLQGSGKSARHVVLSGPDTLDEPAIRALMDEALRRADPPIDPNQASRLIVKSVSAKQRPRRPSAR
jgi:hypothetical protein